MGGIEKHVRDVAEAQAAAGHTVEVIVVGSARRTLRRDEGGVAVRRAAHLLTAASTPISAAMPGLVARARPDVTHVHAPYPFGEAMWLLVGREPLVVSHHADIFRQRTLGRLWRPIQQRVLRRAAAILVGNPRVASGSPTLVSHAHKVRVVPYGVDVARFGSSPRERQAARQRLQEVWPTPVSRAAKAGSASGSRCARDGGEEPGTIAFVGRLRYYKGLDVLLRALVRLPTARLLVVGDGPMEAEWRQLAGELRLDERVRWVGEVSEDDLPGILATADLFVLPSTAPAESYGIAMVEAMAAGLPAISTELGTGTSWVNADGETGLVVAPADDAALAAAIRRLLNDPMARATMGKAARRRALEVFDRDAMLRAIEAVYRSVLSGRSTADKSGRAALR